MFYRIFSKTKKTIKKQAKIPKTPKIIVDVHEKNSLIIANLHNSKQVRLEIKSLKIGDYLIGNTIIERKTISDFINSMINKRLMQQFKQMKKYKQQLLVIEGDLEQLNDFKNPNALRGFILSILTNYNIPIIFTQDDEETSKYLIVFAKQQLKPKIEPTLHSRIPKKIKQQKTYILESFPNIGPITARKLLKKFKTLNNVFKASEQELKPILKSRTQDFINLIKSK